MRFLGWEPPPHPAQSKMADAPCLIAYRNMGVNLKFHVLPTNVSMTLCQQEICHQTHVLCGRTTFGSELKLSTKLIRSLRLL